MSDAGKVTFREAAVKLIALLQEKGSEVLIQNIDLIKRYINEEATTAPIDFYPKQKEDAEMVQ